ncbi:MAG: hypothetical protein Q7J35_06975 [Candidatus Methanoperedens sp.]|nr:hypothetical protein [Candidatus Methanoperedens sp.]
MRKKIFQNNEGISPVLGFILILAIGVSLLSTIQLSFVPVWNTQEELEHLKLMQDDFKVLKSGIETSVQGGTTLSVPLSMGFKYSPKMFVYNPRESAYASLDIQNDTWVEVRYNELFQDGMTDDTSIKNISTSTITYSLRGTKNYDSFIYEHSLIRRGSSEYTTNSQTLLANDTTYLISVKPLGTETINSVERRTLNIYPTSQQKNSVIGQKVWLILHTKPGYVNWWRSNLEKEGGVIKKVDINNGIIIAYIDSMVIKLGETFISTTSKTAPSHASPMRLVKITPENMNLPVEGTINLAVEVQDKYNNPIPNVQVNFNVNTTRKPSNANATATLLQNSAVSGADGRASIMLKTGGAGFYYIDASLTSPAYTTTFVYPASSQGEFLSLAYTESDPEFYITSTLKNSRGNLLSNESISFDSGDGNLSTSLVQTDISGNASTTINVNNATGMKITNIQSGSVLSTSSTISWETINNIIVTAKSGYVFNSIEIPTRVNTTGCVQYGTSSGNYTSIACDSTTSYHSVSLADLIPDAVYYYIVNSSRPGGTNVNSTEYMFVTGIPPASVTNLTNVPYYPLYIKWTWNDPSDSDFDHVKVYVDGVYIKDVQKGNQSFSASFFSPNSSHVISTRTVDIDGNMNATWVNNTASAPSVFTFVFNVSEKTFGNVDNFDNARNSSDGGAFALFYKNSTPMTPDSINDKNVTDNTDIIGNTTNFAGMQSASDSDNYATLRESAAVSRDIPISPTINRVNGTSGSYNATNLNTDDNNIDVTIPKTIAYGQTNTWLFLSNNESWTNSCSVSPSGGSCTLAWTGSGGSPASGSLNSDADNNGDSGARTYTTWWNGTNFTWNNGTPDTATFSYRFEIVTSAASSNYYAYLKKPNGTLKELYNGTYSGTAPFALKNSALISPSDFTSTGNYSIMFKGIQNTSNGASSRNIIRWDTPLLTLTKNRYSTDATYSYTETNPSSSWVNITINDSSYADAGTDVFIYNQTSMAWESIRTALFDGTPDSTHVNNKVIPNPLNYNTGGGVIKIKYEGIDLTTNGNIGVDLLQPIIYYNGYKMNISTTTSSIPADGNYSLETRYKLGNTNEPGYNMDIWDYISSTWGTTQSLTSNSSWTQNNVTLTSNQISDGQVKTRFTDQTPGGTAPGDLYIEFQRIHGFSYHLNITTNTTDIPEANTLQVLQLNYTVSGGNFTVLIKNSTTSGWDTVTTLNSTGMPYRNITLTQDQLIPDGTFSGDVPYVPVINKYYVLVRYVDENPLSNGTLNLDYQRVHSS